MWDSVIVLCFVLRYFMTILVLQSSLMGKRDRELVAFLCLSFWCLVIVVRLYLTMPRACLQFVIVVFPDILTYYFCSRCHFHLTDKIGVIFHKDRFPFSLKIKEVKTKLAFVAVNWVLNCLNCLVVWHEVFLVP